MGLAAAFKPPVVGLDIGSHAVKAVALSRKRSGWTLVAAGEQAMPVGAPATQEQITEAAGTLLDSLGMTRAHIAAALSGHSVIVKRLALPTMSKAELAEAIPWEAEQYIPFALSDVQLDYQVLDGQKSMPAEALDVLLVAARRDRLNERVAAIAATGRRSVVLDVEAFALANAYEMNYPDRTDNLAALIHVGRGSTLVCVLEQGQAAFTRDISLGGGAYLDALERESGLEPMAAQRVLRGAAGAEGVGEVLRDVHQQIVHEIRKTLDFYWSAAKAAPLDRIVLSGGACQVDGLDTALAAEFQTQVERCDPFRRVSRPASIEADGPSYAVAVGLALRREGDR